MGYSTYELPRSLVSYLGDPVLDKCDSTDFSLFTDYIRPLSTVINAVWDGRPLTKSSSSFSNIGFCSRLAKISAHYNASRYIFFSSAGAIYGANSDISKPHSESTSTSPISLYGLHKLQAEQELLSLSFASTQITILRISNIYDITRPSFGNGILPVAVRSLLNRTSFNLYGNGNQLKDYLALSDLTSLLNIMLLASPQHTIYNVSSGSTATVNSILSALQETISLPLSINQLRSHPSDASPVIISNHRCVSEFQWSPHCNIIDDILYNIQLPPSPGLLSE